MPNMNANIVIISLVSLALLFGCIGGVPQEKYDALFTSCEKAKNESSAVLAAESVRANRADVKLSTCTDEKQALDAALALAEMENVQLTVDAAILAQARKITSVISEYDLAGEYYLNAFGPNKIPNTARIEIIDIQVNSLNDFGLKALWENVKNCQSSTECANAKAKVIPYIGNQTARLAVDAAEIVTEERRKTIGDNYDEIQNN